MTAILSRKSLAFSDQMSLVIFLGRSIDRFSRWLKFFFKREALESQSVPISGAVEGPPSWELLIQFSRRTAMDRKLDQLWTKRNPDWSDQGQYLTLGFQLTEYLWSSSNFWYSNSAYWWYAHPLTVSWEERMPPNKIQRWLWLDSRLQHDPLSSVNLHYYKSSLHVYMQQDSDPIDSEGGSLLHHKHLAGGQQSPYFLQSTEAVLARVYARPFT